jgi:hypothetical protein
VHKVKSLRERDGCLQLVILYNAGRFEITQPASATWQAGRQRYAIYDYMQCRGDGATNLMLSVLRKKNAED